MATSDAVVNTTPPPRQSQKPYKNMSETKRLPPNLGSKGLPFLNPTTFAGWLARCSQGRENRLRAQPLPAGARNLEDTGARTKSPLSGAGKTKPKIQTAPMGICDFGDFQMEKKSLRRKVVLVFVQSFDFACQRNVTCDVSMGEYDENM